MPGSYIWDSGTDANPFGPQLIVSASGTQAKITMGDAIALTGGNSISGGVGATLSANIASSTSLKFGTSMECSRSDSASFKWGRTLSISDNTSSSQSKDNITSGYNSWVAKGGCQDSAKLKIANWQRTLAGLAVMLTSASAIIISSLYELSHPPYKYHDINNPPSKDTTDQSQFDFSGGSTAISLSVLTGLIVLQEFLINYFFQASSNIPQVATITLNNSGMQIDVVDKDANGFAGIRALSATDSQPEIEIVNKSANLENINTISLLKNKLLLSSTSGVGENAQEFLIDSQNKLINIKVSEFSQINMDNENTTLMQDEGGKIELGVVGSTCGTVSVEEQGVTIGSGNFAAKFGSNSIKLGNAITIDNSIQVNANGNLVLRGGVIQIG